MDITCWNCKSVLTLDKATVETALAKMDETKLGFHDVACTGCGKANRTPRDVFEAGLLAFSAGPELTKREATKQAKEAAKQRGDEKDAARKAARQKARRG